MINDGRLLAYSADKGEKLFELQTGRTGMGPPITYEVDGKQYVALMGGLGRPGMRRANRREDRHSAAALCFRVGPQDAYATRGRPASSIWSAAASATDGTAQMKPTQIPNNPCFSSGPCAKRPGWTLDALKDASLGRSHRAKIGKNKLAEVIQRSKKDAGHSRCVPARHRSRFRHRRRGNGAVVAARRTRRRRPGLGEL